MKDKSTNERKPKARDKSQRERDRILVSELYLKGYTHRQIANYLKDKFSTDLVPYYVSHVTIFKDVNHLIAEWRKSSLVDINDLKVRELEKLNKLENTYWVAWEKSIEDYEKTTKKISNSGVQGSEVAEKSSNNSPSKRQEMTVSNVKTFGNPSYLQGVERCIERRCKIIGIDAPQKHEIDANVGFADFLKMASADG